MAPAQHRPEAQSGCHRLPGAVSPIYQAMKGQLEFGDGCAPCDPGKLPRPNDKNNSLGRGIEPSIDDLKVHRQIDQLESVQLGQTPR